VSKRVRLWDEVNPFYSDRKSGDPPAGHGNRVDIKARESRGTEAVLNFHVLAHRDARNGSLSDDTKMAFDQLWTEQDQEGESAGAWPWLNFHNAPWEADDSQYYGAALAAVALGTVPGEFRDNSKYQKHTNLLRDYLMKREDKQTLANRAIVLWAA